MTRPRYENPFARVVAHTKEPENEQSCWPWTRHRDRWGYGRLGVYIRGLKKKKNLMAHLVIWLWLEAECENANDLWLAYREFRESGLELDHTCENEPCCNPDHLEPVTSQINSRRRTERILEKRK